MTIFIGHEGLGKDSHIIGETMSLFRIRLPPDNAMFNAKYMVQISVLPREFDYKSRIKQPILGSQTLNICFSISWSIHL